jgi:hypothetical protein
MGLCQSSFIPIGTPIIFRIYSNIYSTYIEHKYVSYEIINTPYDIIQLLKRYRIEATEKGFACLDQELLYLYFGLNKKTRIRVGIDRLNSTSSFETILDYGSSASCGNIPKDDINFDCEELYYTFGMYNKLPTDTPIIVYLYTNK